MLDVSDSILDRDLNPNSSGSLGAALDTTEGWTACIITDHRLTLKGIWKPIYIPESLRGVVVGDARAQKCSGGDFVDPTALKKAKNDNVEVDLAEALDNMKVASQTTPAPVRLPVSLDV